MVVEMIFLYYSSNGLSCWVNTAFDITPTLKPPRHLSDSEEVTSAGDARAVECSPPLAGPPGDKASET
jgi:hypothetical protein